MRPLRLVALASLLAVPPIAAQNAAANPKAMIAALAGKWRSEIRQGANITIRYQDIHLLGDSTKVTWIDSTEQRGAIATSVVGYDATKRSYFLLSAGANQPTPIVSVGHGDSGDLRIRFDSPRLVPDADPPRGLYIATILRVVDATHLEWIGAGGEWRMVLTKVGA